MMEYPVADPGTSEALRAAFRKADKAMRQVLVPILPPEIVEFAGIRMYVDPRDNYTDRMIWRDGQPPELQSLLALTELIEGRNAFVLDIGANSGVYAVALGLAAGPGSRVIAFEPNPAMIGRLGHNVQLNGLGEVVRIEGCALGAVAGEGVLNFRTRNHGQASLLPIRRGARGGGTLVPIRRLTDFVAEAEGHEISVLKIDVEGAEAMALGPLLESEGWMPDAILMETDHADQWDTDLVSRIKARGFVETLNAERNTLLVRQGKG